MFCKNGMLMLNPHSECTAKEKQCFQLLQKCFGNVCFFASFEQGIVIAALFHVKGWTNISKSSQVKLKVVTTQQSTGEVRNYHQCGAVTICFFDDGQDVNTTPIQRAFGGERKSSFFISLKENSQYWRIEFIVPWMTLKSSLPWNLHCNRPCIVLTGSWKQTIQTIFLGDFQASVTRDDKDDKKK